MAYPYAGDRVMSFTKMVARVVCYTFISCVVFAAAFLVWPMFLLTGVILVIVWSIVVTLDEDNL